jgi:hypothetical protein
MEITVMVRQTIVRNPVSNILYILFGLLEILLAFRFVLLLLGANRDSGFVSFVYALSAPFVAPFYGIFPNVAYGSAYFDPATWWHYLSTR